MITNEGTYLNFYALKESLLGAKSNFDQSKISFDPPEANYAPVNKSDLSA